VAPILTDHSFDIITHSPGQTYSLGRMLGRLLGPGDVVCLQGDLGTGKTCLTQGIGAGLNVVGTIHSPTFVFVNEHPPATSGPYLYHIDLYRISDISDVFGLGVEDYIYGDGVTVIEWAERAREMMPRERLWISLSFTDHTKRTLILEATGERYVRILEQLRQELFGQKQPKPTGN